MVKTFLNPEGHQNHISGSKVTTILLKGEICLLVQLQRGRVCACSLRSRLVSRPGRSQGLLCKHLPHSFIHSLIRSSFVKLSLRRRHALFKYGALSHKIDYVLNFLGDFKSWRASKSHHWITSYSNFGERGGFYQVVELHREGSASAACTAGLFMIK